MPVPILEYDMLLEMNVYMKDLIKEHNNETNALVLIRRQLKKAGKIVQVDEVQKRIDVVNGYTNKAHNFVLFIKDYLKTAYGEDNKRKLD
jgi:hypothetical protein